MARRGRGAAAAAAAGRPRCGGATFHGRPGSVHISRIPHRHLAAGKSLQSHNFCSTSTHHSRQSVRECAVI